MLRAVTGLIVLLGTVAGASAEPGLVETCEDARYTESSSACRRLAREASSPDVARDFIVLGAKRDLWSCEGNLTGPLCRDAVGNLFEHATAPADVTQAVALLQRMCVETDEVGCRHVSTAFWYGRGVPADAVASARWYRACERCEGTFDPETLGRAIAEPWVTELTDEGRRERIDALIKAREYDAAVAIAGAAGARGEIEAAIVDTRWRGEVEPLRAQGKLVEAIGTGRRIPGAEARVAAIEAELAAPHLRLMEEARARRLPLATRYHALIAALFDRRVTVPPEQAPDWSALPSRFALAWPDDRCLDLRFVLEDRYPRRDANVEVKADLTCNVRSTSRETTEEKVVGTKRVERQRTRKLGDECTQVQYVCTAELMGKTCYREHCTERTERYTEYEDVPVTERMKVTHYVTHVTVTGTISSRFGTAPIEYTRSGDVSPGEAVGGAADAIQRTIDGWRRAVLQEAIDKELALAKRATGVAAEEHVLRAISLGAPLTLLGPVAGLDVDQVGRLVRSGTVSLPYVSAPGPTSGELALIALAPFDPMPTIEPRPPARPRGPLLPERVRLPRQLVIAANVVLWKDRYEETETGGGVRLELASALEQTGDVVLRASAAASRVDGEVLDGRLAIGTGVRRGAFALVVEVGAGVQSLPVMGEPQTAVDGGWGVAVAVRRELGLGAQFRYESFYGGALDTEVRWTAEVARRSRGGSTVGVELWRHRWEEAQETLFGAGIFYRAR